MAVAVGEQIEDVGVARVGFGGTFEMAGSTLPVLGFDGLLAAFEVALVRWELEPLELPAAKASVAGSTAAAAVNRRMAANALAIVVMSHLRGWMGPAAAPGWTAPPASMRRLVVGRLAHDPDIVNVALAQAGGGDPRELAVALHLGERRAAGVTHCRA